MCERVLFILRSYYILQATVVFFLGLIWKPDCRWRWMFYHCQGPKSCLPMKKEARKSIHVFTKQSNIWALLSYAVHEFGTTFKALNMNLGVYSFWSAFSHISRSKVNLIAQFLKGDANLSSCRVMPTLYWSGWVGLMGCFFYSFYLYSFRFTSTSFKTGSWHIVSPGGCRFSWCIVCAISLQTQVWPRRQNRSRNYAETCPVFFHCTLHIVQSHIARCTFYFGDPVRSPTTARLCIFATHTNADMTSF